MNKPETMEVREWLIKSIGSEQHIAQNIVAKVIQHNYEMAYAALKEHNSLEIAGFGKFYYNVKKAGKQMEKCLSQKIAYQKIIDDENTSDKKRHSYRRRMVTVEDNIKALNNKEL